MEFPVFGAQCPVCNRMQVFSRVHIILSASFDWKHMQCIFMHLRVLAISTLQYSHLASTIQHRYYQDLTNSGWYIDVYWFHIYALYGVHYVFHRLVHICMGNNAWGVSWSCWWGCWWWPAACIRTPLRGGGRPSSSPPCSSSWWWWWWLRGWGCPAGCMRRTGASD